MPVVSTVGQQNMTPPPAAYHHFRFLPSLARTPRRSKSDKVTRHSLDHGRSPCTHDTVRPNPSSRSPCGSIRHTKHSGDGFGIRGNSTRRKGDKHSARAHHRKGTNINRPRAVVQRICLPPLTSLMRLNCNLPLSEGHPARFALQTQVMRRDPRATMSWTNNSKKKKKEA